MKNTKLTVVLIVAVLLGAIWWRVATETESSDNSPVTVVDTEGIEFSEDGLSLFYNGVEGQTALQTLRGLTDVTTEGSSFGEFVVAINGVETVAGETFWSFIVNGELAEVGAGDYIAEEGDVVEWRVDEIEL